VISPTLAEGYAPTEAVDKPFMKIPCTCLALTIGSHFVGPAPRNGDGPFASSTLEARKRGRPLVSVRDSCTDPLIQLFFDPAPTRRGRADPYAECSSASRR